MGGAGGGEPTSAAGARHSAGSGKVRVPAPPARPVAPRCVPKANKSAYGGTLTCYCDDLPVGPATLALPLDPNVDAVTFLLSKNPNFKCP
jgi:hypothetical protein